MVLPKLGQMENIWIVKYIDIDTLIEDILHVKNQLYCTGILICGFSEF